MSDKRARKDSVEVSSQTLQDELVAIKDRLSAIETIQSISNAAVVKKYVEDHLKTEKGKAIMKECAEARTKAHLIEQFRFNNRQALDHHLKPLLRRSFTPASRGGRDSCTRVEQSISTPPPQLYHCDLKGRQEGLERRAG